jgi:UDP-N-acetylglucosamine--N-acetylmuramyl-(pentapeptide) pyrophosphoryl-undecaprenol N-acetylglucosamine transferase
MKILFTGGGTAGHIFPIIAVAREIKKKDFRQEIKLFYLGPKDGFSENLLLKEGIVVKTIIAGKIRRYIGIKSFFQNFFDILIKIPISFIQSLFYVFVISPDIVFSKGGYGSLAPVISSWLLLIPIFLHESDIIPGLANRILARFATEIFVSFPSEKTKYFKPDKMICLGNPIRLELLEGNHLKAKDILKLGNEKRPLILVLGGSQGSQRINDVILAILPEILSNYELVHQTGKNNFKEVEAEVKASVSEELLKYYHPFSFLEEEQLKHIYQLASLVISRSGSGTIFEIASLGKPAILIPLPESAQNHQLENAYFYAQSGAALVIEEVNLTPHFFLERIKYLLSNPIKLEEMRIKALDFSKIQAARIIAEYIREYLKH